MATDKSIRKGDYLRGGFYPAAANHANTALLRAYPELEGVLEAAGPVPSPARIRELAAEREALQARMAELKRRIAELRAAEKRK